MSTDYKACFEGNYGKKNKNKKAVSLLYHEETYKQAHNKNAK